MVVDIAEEKGGFLAHQGRLGPGQRPHHLAQRPDRPPDENHGPLEGMDGLEGGRRGSDDHLLLEFLECLSDPFEKDKEVVDDGVEQGIGEVVGAGFADPALGLADSLPHRLEDVTLLFLERKDEIRPHQQAHLLFLDQNAILPGRREHPQHHEQIVVEILQLGTLAGVHDVFQNQGMNAKVVADGLDNLGPVDPVDVDPGHRRTLLEGKALLHRRHLLLPEAILVVVEDGDGGSGCPGLAQVNQAARRQPGFARSADHLGTGHLFLRFAERRQPRLQKKTGEGGKLSRALPGHPGRIHLCTRRRQGLLVPLRLILRGRGRSLLHLATRRRGGLLADKRRFPRHTGAPTSAGG